MTKKSKKKRHSKHAQKFSLSEVNDGSSKVSSIFKEKADTQSKQSEGKSKENGKGEKSETCPFFFDEPEWFRNIIVSLSEHLEIIPQRVVF